MLPEGPTRNREYNYLLTVAWPKEGYVVGPECEECGCDLTDQDVYESVVQWVCGACAHDLAGPYDSGPYF